MILGGPTNTATPGLATKLHSFGRGLIVKIVDEKLEHTHEIDDSHTFESGFEEARAKLSDREAAYLLYRNNDEILVITYVPDDAKVRQKMLYASSKQALTRELGASNPVDLFVTELEDISENGYKSHVRHAKLNAPLTREEESLKYVKENEAGVAQSHSVNITHSKGIEMKHAADFDDKLASFESASEGAILPFTIDVSNEEVIPGSISSVSNWREIKTPESHPQYTLYKSPSGVVFIYTCPSGSKIKERMLYAASRRVLLSNIEKSITVAKTVDVGDEDLDLDEVVSEKKETTAKGGLRFKRPTRPGR